MEKYIVITTFCDKKEIADDKFLKWINENTKYAIQLMEQLCMQDIFQ